MKKYAETVEDVELLSVCKVVESHKWATPTLVKMIRDKAVDVKEAEIILTTAHKSNFFALS